MAHLKRYAMPKDWCLPRKEKVFVVCVGFLKMAVLSLYGQGVGLLGQRKVRKIWIDDFPFQGELAVEIIKGQDFAFLHGGRRRCLDRPGSFLQAHLGEHAVAVVRDKQVLKPNRAGINLAVPRQVQHPTVVEAAHDRHDVTEKLSLESFVVTHGPVQRRPSAKLGRVQLVAVTTGQVRIRPISCRVACIIGAKQCLRAEIVRYKIAKPVRHLAFVFFVSGKRLIDPMQVLRATAQALGNLPILFRNVILSPA